MELTFNFELDDFQKEAQEHINRGESVVVCAPTGAGKTAIAEIAVHRALEINKRLFYTTPLKALSNQKYRDFTHKYGEDKVGLLTGDISINRGAQIVVMTTEVFRNMLYGTNLGKVEENLQNVEYVVLDEVHYMNDEQRGTVWEESIIYCPNNIKLIALSATVANAKELTDWINSVHSKTHLVNTDFRPVPLRHYYLGEPNLNDIVPLFAPGGALNSKIKALPVKNKFSKAKRKTSPATLVEILHRKDMLPAIHFTFSRKKCDAYMFECADLRLLTPEEEEELRCTIKEYVYENPYLENHRHLKALYAGVASHHAGLLPSLKVLVEKLFQKGLIKVVFATETLAAGINMPARTTVISSISKRTDSGHRKLTASEFLQMSGRAGRRGMDEVGHVVVVGNPFDDPVDVHELVSSKAEPLESRFTPSYSMVLNLLQKFDMEQSRELILKSFGYFSSTNRLKPFYDELNYVEERLDAIENFNCPYKLKTSDLLNYNKLKNTFVQYKKITNTLLKQARHSGGKNAPEVVEYSQKTKDLYHKMEQIKCNYCKMYKKHIREADLQERFEKKREKIKAVIETQKDIYWNRFVKLKEILGEYQYVESDFPTECGFTTSCLRTENELYLAELIFKGIFNNLNHSELAGIVCAISTEDDRMAMRSRLRYSSNVKNSIYRARDIMRKIERSQKEKGIENMMNLNPKFSAFIEHWINGCEWEELFIDGEFSEGDVVRAFKRTIDVLRQLCTVANIPQELANTARLAIDLINRDPIKED
ncbi:MAG: DEAD/DEAH box helicase [Candidatus Gastranaerophilales bacterium]|nr:DEAD/DEAH box helicase [Candidatus Gastranaerophilales bacterium]